RKEEVEHSTTDVNFAIYQCRKPKLLHLLLYADGGFRCIFSIEYIKL
ncbi:15818_t:CDS:2, partial [Funneliformis mosseae]